MFALQFRRLVAATLAFGGLGVLGLCPSRAQAATLTVTNLNDGNTDGVCSAAGSGDGCTLREAITIANVKTDSDDILFDPSLSGNLALQSALPPIANTLTITDVPGTVSISANGGNFSVLRIRNGAGASISGFTLRDSNATNGGGLYVEVGGSAVLDGCAIANNNASQSGGGIYALAAKVSLRNCDISGNSAVSGGGIFMEQGSTLVLSQSALYGNSAQDGGGLYNRISSSTVNNCSVFSNRTTNVGGGLYNDRGTMTVDSCTITKNSTKYAGSVTSYRASSNPDQGTTTLTNTIVALNEGTDVDTLDIGTFTSGGYNLVGTSGSNALSYFNQPGDRTGVTSAQLNLGSPQGNGFRPVLPLLPGSIAINNGNTSLTTDQRGVSRPQGVSDDVGTYEVGFNESLVVTTLADENNGTSDPTIGAGTSLREAITYANSNADQSDITFAAGLTGTISLDSALPNLSTNLSITAASGITLNAQSNEFRVLTISNGTAQGPTVTLSGLTLTGGLVLNGAGLLVNGNATLNNCNVSNNFAYNYAGGIYLNAGTLALNFSTVSGNRANYGGGLFTEYGTTFTLNSSTLSSNIAYAYGGGFYSRGSSVALSNSSIFGNPGASGGGGIFTFSPTTISNCTIVGNNAPSGQGGGIQSGGSVTLSNSIVATNSGTDLDFYNGQGTFTSGGYNLVGTSGSNTLDAFNNNGDKVRVDSGQLQFGPVDNYGGPTATVPIGPNSLAYNAGDPAVKRSSTSYDQRGPGYARVSSGRLDVGAYEYQVPFALSINGTVYNAVARGGLEGITIEARNESGTVVTQTQTDTQGKYTLTLSEGSYTLSARKGTDVVYRFVTSFTNPITIAAESNAVGYDFRIAGIGGRIISPSNVGISGIKVNLYFRGDTGLTNPVETSTTDAQGFFSLDYLQPDTWNVVPVSSNYSFTPTSRFITVNDAPVFTSFKAEARNLVTGTVFNAVAVGKLSGITIKAVKSGTTAAVTTVTDSQGNYTLSLTPGTYTITANRAGDSTLRLAPLFTNPVTTKATTTVCQFRAIGIGGRIISPTNVGISGVKVSLYAQNDTTLTKPLSTSTSDAQGFFSLDSVAAGTYLVAPVAPTTYTYTPASRVITVQDQAVFTSFKASVKNAPKSLSRPLSSITLSGVSANLAAGTLTLKFTGPLDAASVADMSHYAVAVNGEEVSVEGAQLRGGDTVILTLAQDALTKGATVNLAWAGLLDTHSLLVQGETTFTS